MRYTQCVFVCGVLLVFCCICWVHGFLETLHSLDMAFYLAFFSICFSIGLEKCQQKCFLSMCEDKNIRSRKHCKGGFINTLVASLLSYHIVSVMQYTIAEFPLLTPMWLHCLAKGRIEDNMGPLAMSS